MTVDEVSVLDVLRVKPQTLGELEHTGLIELLLLRFAYLESTVSLEDVLSAMGAQMKATAYAHSGFFTTDVAEELAQRLATDAPGDLNNVYLVSGGSEAVESALKMARQYFVENGEPERRVFIARQQSYHGNTLGALSVPALAATALMGAAEHPCRPASLTMMGGPVDTRASPTSVTWMAWEKIVTSPMLSRWRSRGSPASSSRCARTF